MKQPRIITRAEVDNGMAEFLARGRKIKMLKPELEPRSFTEWLAEHGIQVSPGIVWEG